VGPSIRTELQSVESKVGHTHPYPTTANYWAPLIDEDEDDDEETSLPNVINNISDDANVQQEPRSIQAWINQRIQRNTHLTTKASTMLVDSGATSHFMRAEEQLPITGISTKVVFLPNGETITASHKTELPFPTLSAKARQADVLPGLRQNSLVSVGKLSDAGYTTIFHPKGEGVTVHRQGSLKITPFRKPILQGWRDSNGLW